MAPVYRREREARLAEEHKRLLPAANQPHAPLDVASYGDNWGLKPERDGKKKWQPRHLDDLCKEAGITREEFEAVNAEAVAARRRFGR